MAQKLSSRQQAQVAFLSTVPPKMQRVHGVIEQMATMQADDVVLRSLCRILDELRAGAQSLGLGALSNTAGVMATMARRGGGLQMKVRGLREQLGTLKINYEGALRAASTPAAAADGDTTPA